MYESQVAMYESQVAIYESQVAMYESQVAMYESQVAMYEWRTSIEVSFDWRYREWIFSSPNRLFSRFYTIILQFDLEIR